MKVVVAIFGEHDFWKIPASSVDELRSRFPHVHFAHATDEASLVREARDADIAFSSILRGDALAAAGRLRWIHSSAAGVGSLLSPELKRREITLTNSRGIHASFIAEHVLAVTLILFRKLQVAFRRQAEFTWALEEICSDPPVRTVRGSRAGIIGLGAIGSAVAACFAALGADVRAIRRRPELGPTPGVSWVGGTRDLPDLLSRVDVVAITAPQTAMTRELIGAAELVLMKPEAILVNVSRGKLVRERDLAEALADGTIAGAALDVFEHEPLDHASPLWRLPNVVITPHTSGFRPDYWQAATELFSQNLGRFERGETLLNVVDLDEGY
jgi:D-2-hydroxyacid dehydrogenase (NADP+)